MSLYLNFHWNIHKKSLKAWYEIACIRLHKALIGSAAIVKTSPKMVAFCDLHGTLVYKIVSFKKWFNSSVDHCSPSDLSVQDSMYCDPV
jgi:hypothetical protein